jgi:predicted transposase/invertase (TIGR01784 family)
MTTAIKFLDPKNDYAFKRIFGTEQNKEILVHFLNDTLAFPNDAKIQSVTFLKPIQDPDALAKKQSIVDVLCKDEKGTQYIVEMQVARTEHFAKRAQYYAAKAYTNQINSGEGYGGLKQVIFLAITDFIMFPDKREVKSDHVILDRESHAHDLTDFSFTLIELPKFQKTIDELESNVDKWIYFFKHAEETDPDELEKMAKDDKIISQAYHALDQFYWTDNEIALYEQERKSQLDSQAIINFALHIGRKEGRLEGHKEGLKEGKIEVAKKMISKGIDLETILGMTGLSKEDL